MLNFISNVLELPPAVAETREKVTTPISAWGMNVGGFGMKRKHFSKG
jgi:hypothetical protein